MRSKKFRQIGAIVMIAAFILVCMGSLSNVFAASDLDFKIDEDALIDMIKEKDVTVQDLKKELDELIKKVQELREKLDKLNGKGETETKPDDKTKPGDDTKPGETTNPKIKELEDKIKELQKQIEDNIKKTKEDAKKAIYDSKMNIDDKLDAIDKIDKAKTIKEIEEIVKKALDKQPNDKIIAKLFKELKGLIDKAEKYQTRSKDLTKALESAYNVIFDKDSTEKDYKEAIYVLERALKNNKDVKYRLTLRDYTEGDKSIKGYTERRWKIEVFKEKGKNVIAKGYSDRRGEFDLSIRDTDLKAFEVLRVVAYDSYDENLKVETRIYVKKAEKKTEEKKTNNTVKANDFTEFAIFPVGQAFYTTVSKNVVNENRMDAVTFIQNNRTMVSLRYLAYSLGFNVDYNANTREAIFTNTGANNKLNANTITMSIDTGIARDSYGQIYYSDAKPVILNNRVYASISNIARMFGATQGNINDGVNNTLEWDGVKYLVYVFKNVK